jgi:hypothetical protein
MRSSITLLIISAAIGAALLVGPAAVEAQSMAKFPVSVTAVKLTMLSRERAARWAQSAPIVRCEPAPLTERPGAAAEFGRPQVAPLEAAFLDAITAKRTFAGRSR